jgi:hypothetical protein
MPTPRPFGLPMKVIVDHTFARVVNSPKKLVGVMVWNLGFGLFAMVPVLMSSWFPPQMPASAFYAFVGVFTLGVALAPRIANLDLDGKPVYFPWLMSLVLLQGVVNFLTPLPPTVDPVMAFVDLVGLRIVPAMMQGMGLAKLLIGWKNLLEKTRREFEGFPLEKQRAIYEGHQTRNDKTRLEATIPKSAMPRTPRPRRL